MNEMDKEHVSGGLLYRSNRETIGVVRPDGVPVRFSGRGGLGEYGPGETVSAGVLYDSKGRTIGLIRPDGVPNRFSSD